MPALPIPACAASLGISTKRLRRMIEEGAPVIRRGRRGAGHSTLLDPVCVSEWLVSRGDHSAEIERRRLAREVIDNVAQSLAACCRADSGPHKRLVAAHAVITFEHTAARICAQFGLPPLERAQWPTGIQQIARAVGISPDR